MTFTEFMDKIAEFDIDFRIRQVSTNSRGLIHMVRDDDGRCPICAVVARMTGVEYSNSAWWAAGESIGLDSILMNDIVTAADDEPIATQYITPVYTAIRALIGEK